MYLDTFFWPGKTGEFLGVVPRDRAPARAPASSDNLCFFWELAHRLLIACEELAKNFSRLGCVGVRQLPKAPVQHHVLYWVGYRPCGPVVHLEAALY